MDKLFLLGLFALYLSRDGESSMSFLRPTEIVLEGVACHVCGRFVKGRCLNSEDKCVKEIPSACEAKVFFTIVNNVWKEIYAILNCNSNCKETQGVAKGMQFKIFCCDKDFCNKPRYKSKITEQ
ncbi:prostate and testis expressed protein 4 [Trichosurus vulpecula]|uniref:prostate and testis expressed protein 4 n=1 Tax=Trichosurus vulpecula TaxID=9337 RepID=UPI00186AD5AD|nr:prostate and testis expressed protein 4 [Trichosurus vulpecula]